MNITGKYNIYKNNELIYESPNLITENGKSIILQYLAGAISSWASYIGTGAGNTAASLSDYKLYYEITRLPVANSIPFDSTSYLISGTGASATSSITVSANSASLIKLGQSVSGGGISSSITSTVTSVSGSTVYLSYPVQNSFSGSVLTFKTPKSVRFSSRLDQGITCKIYELAMFNTSKLQSENRLDGKIITNFDEDVSSTGWSAGVSASSESTYTPRLGNLMLKISPVSGTPASAVLGDIATVPAQIGLTTSNAGQLYFDTTPFSASYDTAKVLLYATASGASITITGQDNTTGLTTNTITLVPKTAVTAGANIIETYISKGNTYNNSLSKIQISASSSASVDLYFDSLKLSKTEDLSIYTGMVSRSVLSTPISKSSAETIDIEYELFLFP
jgi:hypothetical protein